ncbi:MAG: TRAP transporter substrate-binding protein [Sagittula sp.]|uniref:TRAP transporter substrate-binding protein n=1 Tax=Sagittula sp. TaxID=2038081 RepID=UPI0040599068
MITRERLLAGLIAIALPAIAGAQEITLRMGLINVPPTGYGEAMAEVPARIEEATNGRVKVELLPTLIPGGQLASALRDGRIDMIGMVDPYVSGEEPRLNVGHLPGLIRTVDEYKSVYDQYLEGVVTEVWSERYNGHLLAHGLWYGVPIFTREPLDTVEKFKGKKIRVAAATTADVLTQLGAQPADIAFAEQGAALQRGVIDGVATAYGTATMLKLGEMAQYMALWQIADISSWSVVMNNAVWDKLPDDVKPQITEAMRSLTEDRFASYAENNEKKRQALMADGVQWVEISQAENDKALSPDVTGYVYDKWYARAPSGVDAKAVAQKVADLLGRTLP